MESPSQLFHRMSKAWSRLCGIRKFMVMRCYDPRQRSYPCYGAKGVRVCDAWRESPDSFFDWAISNGYADDLVLDRKEPTGNYEPDNCRWVTGTQQQANARKQRAKRICTSQFKGVSRQVRETGAVYIYAQINYGGKHYSLGRFGSEEEAARAYDSAAMKHFGEFARLNFPLESVGA